jgi:hypothetical protein
MKVSKASKVSQVSRATFLASCAGLGMADTFAAALWRTAKATPAHGLTAYGSPGGRRLPKS